MRNLEIHFIHYALDLSAEAFYVQATDTRSFSISYKNGKKSSYNQLEL